MKTRVCLLATVVAVVLVVGVPASAQVLYENGPINGETDAWTFNLGFTPSDTFTISTGPSVVTGFSFGAWLTQGDVLLSAEVVLSSQELGTGTIFFDGTVNFTQSGCFVNNYGYDVCTETGSIAATPLINGTYWVTLENGMDTLGDPVYWDENQGVGCHSPGCPSEATESFLGSIPSEAFSILGTPSSGTGSVPEPGSLALVGGGFFAIVETLRRRMHL
jgi:hypothetical protein